ncbi:MAG: sigma-70 family RNA polymerase sigma factor [Chloroflexota bacterium]|nr:sigma-70 family RNA polymerase sigma factor [Chloroflexota bacterium]
MQDDREAASTRDTAKPVTSVRNQLLAFDEGRLRSLSGIICSYVQNMGLASADKGSSIAQDILQEAFVEALAHADHFDPERQVTAWLLGIALNIIRHKKAQAAKHGQREFSFNQLSRLFAEPMSEDELLDRINPATQAGPEELVVSDDQVATLLSLVSEEDQQVLRLAFLEDFGREALAQRLGVTTGAARVRLHRALVRLRAAWVAGQAQTWKGDAHE